jgi:hypothetical protein
MEQSQKTSYLQAEKELLCAFPSSDQSSSFVMLLCYVAAAVNSTAGFKRLKALS